MKSLNRRDALSKLSLLGVAGASLSVPTTATAAKPIKWKMVTTWPKNFPGLGTGAEKIADLITELSGGELRVKVVGAKELVPAFEVFDAVSDGVAEMGHGAAYYWKGKNEAAQFFSTIPFGFTAQEMDAWLFYGGGMELWEKTYEPFGVIPIAAGNSGVQMAGWFNKEINSTDDLKGLKMRIPGLGGEVLKRLGGTPVNLPGGELFTALKSGNLDATEWVGPYNDLAFGLHKAAKYYYYPGWHEPGTTMEALVNADAFAKLPAHLQAIVKTACRVVNADMVAEFNARNSSALKTLRNDHGVIIKKLPDSVLASLHKTAIVVVDELAKSSSQGQSIYDSLSAFKQSMGEWTAMSEYAFLNARNQLTD